MQNILTKMKTDRLNPDREEGFTLIELMIVVVVIGILAAVSIPIFANQQKAAIAASVQSDVANARSFIPSPATGRMSEPTDIAKKVTVTDTNVGVYYLSANKQEACYQVTHEYSSTDKVSYKFLTSVGKVQEGTCDTFNGTTVSNVTISNSASNGAAATPSPSPSASTGGSTVVGGGGGTTGSTTNEYLTAQVNLDNINTDWNGVYTARVTLTPKQNKAINWSISWTDPNVTGIQGSSQMDCSVASGGVITCSGRPNHYSTDNFQWGNTFTETVQLQTKNKSTAPSNPTVYIVAQPK